MSTNLCTPKAAAETVPATVPVVNATAERDEHRTLTVEELQRLPFFAELSPELLPRIAPFTKYSHFEKGEEILAQGDAADRFYVVESGRVKLECTMPELDLHVEDVGPGGVVGFSWLFTPEKVHFTAKALEPVKAVFVYGTLLREEFEICPQLGHELAMATGQVMLHRLEAVVHMIGGIKYFET